MAAVFIFICGFAPSAPARRGGFEQFKDMVRWIQGPVSPLPGASVVGTEKAVPMVNQASDGLPPPSAIVETRFERGESRARRSSVRWNKAYRVHGDAMYGSDDRVASFSRPSSPGHPSFRSLVQDYRNR